MTAGLSARAGQSPEGTIEMTKTRTDKYLANIYFFILMALLWGVNFIPEDILTRLSDNLTINASISEFIIVVPALLVIAIWLIIRAIRFPDRQVDEGPFLSDRLMFRAVKPSTILMTILFALTISPLITLCNLISQIFVDNTVLEYSTDIIDTPMPVAVFVMAILPPLCEELAFRGVVYGGYRRDCRPVGAIFMSALLFGLMHGNVNQCVYAFVMGVAMALMVEATGSIWPSILIHAFINLRTVVAMFLLDHLQEGIFEEYLEMGSDAATEGLGIYILIYAILSVLTTLMAGAILSWVAKNEDRANPLKILRANKEYKTTRCSVWSVSLVIGIIAAIALIVIVEMYT